MPRRTLWLIFIVAVTSLACYERADRNPYGRWFSEVLDTIDRMMPALSQANRWEQDAWAAEEASRAAAADRMRGDPHAEEIDTFLTRASVRLNAAVMIGVAVLMVVLVMGTLMYVIEGPANGFTSIPVSVYWAITTMTTVGFGDVHAEGQVARGLVSGLIVFNVVVVASLVRAHTRLGQPPA